MNQFLYASNINKKVAFHQQSFTLYLIVLVFFFFFLGPHLWHMDVPRLGVELEDQLLVYATATRDLSHVSHLHHRSQQSRILNPLSEARDQTHNFWDTSPVLNQLNHNGNSLKQGLGKLDLGECKMGNGCQDSS